MHGTVVRFLVVALLLAPVGAWADATISGTVTTEDGAPIAGASVFIGDLETLTAANGTYSQPGVPAGPNFVVVFKEGFRTGSRDVTVPATGTLTEDFRLALDLLYSDTLVVTGTRNPQTKRESSVSITTMNAEQIEERAPRSTADLLRVIPGFYVESSGGEVGGNLWARGLPADGSYRYVALMEDGMPVFDATELFFVNADIFIRFDENVQEMEAVRGGNAALYGSNAPGGVVNLISKSGTNEPHTDLSFKVGTDGLYRVGLNHRGPLADDWTYSVGGFYRFDDGVRDPGYPASRGGQIKGNLTRTFADGYIRGSFKVLDDSNVFYLPVPFQAGGLSPVAGFPDDGTLHTPEGNHVRAPRPGGGFVDLPLEDGQTQEGFSLMLDFSKSLGGGWLLQDTARYMDVDHSWNAVVPFDTIRPTDFARGFTGGPFEYSYTNHNEPFNAAPNNLLLLAGLWHVEKPMENFSNQLQLTKTFETDGLSHNLTLGSYFGTYTVGNTWYFNDILTDVRTQPRFVDLTIFDGAGNPLGITENGFRRYGSLFVNANGDVDLFAFFAGDQIQVNDRLRVDLGLRYEENTFRQFDELTANFNLGDPTTLADDAVGGGTGATRNAKQSFEETAVSVGLNYLVNDNVAIWGRAGTGFKMPILDNYLFGGNNLEAESLLQYEVGARFGSPRLGANATLYFVQVEDFPSQDARVIDGRTVFVTAFVGQAETTGIELELVAEPVQNFRVNLVATLQEPEYTDFIEGGQSLNGKSIRRIAEEIIDLSLSYGWDRFSIGANWNYYGDRFANNANTIVLPSFDVTNLTASYELSANARLSLALLNAFDDVGLTEGNPRLDEAGRAAGAVYLARPVLPRRATLAIDFSF